MDKIRKISPIKGSCRFNDSHDKISNINKVSINNILTSEPICPVSQSTKNCSKYSKSLAFIKQRNSDIARYPIDQFAITLNELHTDKCEVSYIDNTQTCRYIPYSNNSPKIIIFKNNDQSYIRKRNDNVYGRIFKSKSLAAHEQQKRQSSNLNLDFNSFALTNFNK